MKFQYYLKKADGELINSGTDNFASYVNLSPGKYIFELYASNTEKVWSKEPYLLPIFVRPHWSETWWFYGLVFLTILLIIGS